MVSPVTQKNAPAASCPIACTPPDTLLRATHVSRSGTWVYKKDTFKQHANSDESDEI